MVMGHVFDWFTVEPLTLSETYGFGPPKCEVGVVSRVVAVDVNMHLAGTSFDVAGPVNRHPSPTIRAGNLPGFMVDLLDVFRKVPRDEGVRVCGEVADAHGEYFK